MIWPTQLVPCTRRERVEKGCRIMVRMPVNRSPVDWVVLAALVLLLTWCSACKKDNPLQGNNRQGQRNAEPENALSVDDARAALIVLVKSLPAGTFAARSLDALKNDQARVLEDGGVALGPWLCYFSLKRFSFSFASAHMLEIYEGEFVRDSKGTWRAVVDREARN